MDTVYPYLKKRSEFGSTCLFANEGPNVLLDSAPNKTLYDQYILKNPVNKSTQKSAVLSLNEVNTWRAEFSERGIFHEQGGWPKDLNLLDEEAVIRFKKKLEREDNYIASMRELSKPIEHAILQNNAINIYEKYFENATPEYSTEESLSRIQNSFRDPHSKDCPRTVSHLSWSPTKTTFAASYCDLVFQTVQPNRQCFLWNVEISNAPEITFDAESPVVNLEWNVMDYHLLAAGHCSGQISIYDTRRAPHPVEITTDVMSHRDPVHSIIWINSKTGTEFFTTSADGVVKWWDCRNMSRTTDSIILDVSKNQSMVNAYGASCLEYDPSIPAKYMVGTERGAVICGNRKGVSLAEKLPWVLKAHTGPIYSLMRNGAFSKMFLTVADWSARIWSEECKESAIMWVNNYKAELTGGEWSKGRYSVFCVTRKDGYLDLWDLLLNQRNPIVSMKVSDRPLTAVRIEDQGKYIVVGDEGGFCCLVQLGEGLSTCGKNDKNILSAMFDRESRREKILEGRMREIRLAMRMKTQQAEDSKEGKGSEKEAEEERQERILKAEEDYFEEVNKVLGIGEKEGEGTQKEAEQKEEEKTQQEARGEEPKKEET